MATDDLGFFIGEQWTPEQIAEMKELERFSQFQLADAVNTAMLVINRIREEREDKFAEVTREVARNG